VWTTRRKKKKANDERKFMSSTLIDFHFIIAKTPEKKLESTRSEREREKKKNEGTS
jgi:hypothetical protein